MELSQLNFLRELSREHRIDLPNIHSAAKRSMDRLELLRHKLTPLGSSDCSIVAFGSLARRELTSESDLDWSLLIDGPAKPAHKALSHEIARVFTELDQKPPNPAGAFGKLTFSHDLVHSIGGESDSNRNTTQRILLLLESINLGKSVVWERVIRVILERYFAQEPYGPDQNQRKTYFPRFLVNDVVRFWRTMAVDYAAKVVDRGGNGWALRNAKLRLSRKLIFVSGLLFAYEVHLKPPVLQADPAGGPDPSSAMLLTDAVFPLAQTPPLEILARALSEQAASGECVRDIFVSYDAFLGILNDKERRSELNDLCYENSSSSNLFKELRAIGAQFQKGLDAFFLDGPAPIRELTRKYAIF